MAYIYETADAAQNTTTTYNINVGDFFIGTTSTVSDVVNSDWIRFQGAANTTYTVSLSSLGLFAAAIDDPVLQGYNSAGVPLFSNDDGGPNFNAQFTFTTTAAGSYYIEAKGFGSNESGQYIATVTLGARASFDHMMGGSALYGAEFSWSPNSAGTAVNVTYAIRASGDAADSGGTPTLLQLLTAAQTLAAQQAATTYSELSGITFTQVNAGGTSNNATVLFGAYSSMSDPAGAYAWFPGSTRADDKAGDVWLNNDAVDGTNLQFGTYSYYTMIHELGHAVGLSHPGDYNAGVGGQITYAGNAQFTQDSHQYTIMSYFSETETGANFGGGYADTPMLYDVYALHQLYGADYTTRAGNTVYGFNSNAGAVYNFLINTDPAICIWDGAGLDSIDVSGWTMAQTINLNEGTFSSVGGLLSNLSIAFGALIENAIGGSGVDTIFGNAASNILNGGVGNDVLYGGLGDDTFIVDSNLDGVIENVGQGIDTVQSTVAFTQLDAGNTLENLTYIGSSSGTLYGNSANNTLTGGALSDSLNGFFGVDILYGGGGDDFFYIDNQDYMNGGAGSDAVYIQTVVGTSLNLGASFVEYAVGYTGADVLNGSTSTVSVTLIGGGGADVLRGGSANDYIYFDSFDNTIDAGGGTNDVLVVYFDNNGVNLNITAANAEYVIGGTGNDILNASGSVNSVVIQGGAGADTITGGNNSDYLYGNAGADVFRVTSNAQFDAVFDFVDNGGVNDDKIDLRGLGVNFDTFAEVLAASTDYSGTSVINFGANNQLYLFQISKNNLGADDFIFV